MSGSVSQMLSLAIVSVAAYIPAHLLKSEPIYESLLVRILNGRGENERNGTDGVWSGERDSSPAGSTRNTEGAEQENISGREKVLSEFVIMSGSVLEGKKVSDITWPKNCLLAAVEREGKELIPRGRTILMAGDRLTVITDAGDAGYVHDKLENLCYTSF